MIDCRERLVSLSHARKHLIPPSDDGRPVNPSTVYRWVRVGLEGLDGHRIRLEVTYRGQTPFTSAESIERFFAAVTTARLARIERTQNQAADVSDADLAAAGLR